MGMTSVDQYTEILAEQRAKRRSSLMRLLRKHYKPLQNLVATSRPDALNLVYKRLAHAVHPSRAHTWRSP